MKKLFLYLLIVTAGLTSCTKIIEIDTKNAEPQLVIEGKIVDRLIEQQILITKTVGYDEVGVYPKVTGATVRVTDSRGNNYAFTEKSPGIYVNRMRGVYGVTYTMDVTAEGKNYQASSKMPNSVKLDSIGVVSNSFFGEERKTAAAFFVDPAKESNSYHFNLYINGVFADRIFVENDRLTNGNNLRVQLFYQANDDDDGLKSGDNFSIEMEGIDSNIFNYWFALSQQDGRGPNQGTTPSNPTSNISNGALGYFSVNTFQRMNATVK